MANSRDRQEFSWLVKDGAVVLEAERTGTRRVYGKFWSSKAKDNDRVKSV